LREQGGDERKNKGEKISSKLKNDKHFRKREGGWIERKWCSAGRNLVGTSRKEKPGRNRGLQKKARKKDFSKKGATLL